MADQAKWQALMKWTMKHTDGTTPTEATPISEDKRRFLEMVMNEGVIDENERVKDILRILEGEDPRLVFAAEDGTIADEGEQPSPEAGAVQGLAAGRAAHAHRPDRQCAELRQDGRPARHDQRHPQVRAAVVARAGRRGLLRRGAEQPLLPGRGRRERPARGAVHARARDQDVTCRVKALLGISCLVRHHAAAETRFLGESCKGLELMRQNLEEATDIRLQRKSLFFLRYLIRNSRSTADLVLQKNFFIQSAAAFITHEDVDLCECSVEGLAEFAMIGPDFMAACKKPELDLLAKCDQRIKQIDALEGEDKEFAQETKTRVEYLKKVLTV